MPKFDVNDFVWVKLTERGREIHKERWEPFSVGEYRSPEVSTDGYSRFQLHDLMATFGRAMHLGADLPFATKIILESERPVIIQTQSKERE